jgi:CTP:molybdopterin cytidylyltransferase MocA
MKTIYHQLLNYLQSEIDVQLGLLIDVKGSAPQIPGATTIFNKEKVLNGTLGGGLLEKNAQLDASIASINNQNILKLVPFTSEIDDQIGAICGGSALYLIDSNPKKHLDVFSEIIKSFNIRKGGVLVSFINNQKSNLTINKYWIEENKSIPEEIENNLNLNNLKIEEIFANRKTVWINNLNSLEKPSLFIEPMHPMSQLIIVGAGHIGQALNKTAQLVDFEVTIIDNRLEYNNSSEFPNANLKISPQLSDALKTVIINSNTYIVITTQGHRTDMEALRWCIQSNAVFIGTIGSKRKSALMKMKFIQESWATEEELNFINSPIGIDIHSKTVNEIAISITAQLIQKRYENNYLNQPKKVSSIILAAGKSTRMGTQKLLLPYENTSIIKSIVTKSMNSNVKDTIVVLGSHKNEIKKELNKLSIQFADNNHFENGMLSSVQKGISVVPKNIDGVLILLGDQPMVSCNLINRLIAVFNKTSKGIIVPIFEGKRGHPLLISKKYFNKINKLNPAIGLRELLNTHNSDVLEIAVQIDVILKDIDTPEDYQLATNNLYL